MEKFESSGILTGFIKQLLSSFNLPKLRVYTKDQADYANMFGTERYDVLETFLTSGAVGGKVLFAPYIREGKLQIYTKPPTESWARWVDLGEFSTPQHVHYYNRGDYIKNQTKQLIIKNNIYDAYTHKYLGDYLRFIRDFDGIDLMSLYNCFSNQYAKNIDFSFKPTTSSQLNSKTIVVSAYSNDFTVYKLPVKFFKEYTIAIDSMQPVEFFCGFDFPEQRQSDVMKKLLKATYRNISYMQFAEPILYSVLLPGASLEDFEKEELAELAQVEQELSLFIKINNNNKSSIVVLEGNYCAWNNFCSKITDDNNRLSISRNKTIISDEAVVNNAILPKITQLQLLKMNTGKQAPFADRLIEFLLENVITDLDSIRENTRRFQLMLAKGYDALVELNDKNLQAIIDKIVLIENILAVTPLEDAQYKELKQQLTELQMSKETLAEQQIAFERYLFKSTNNHGIWQEGFNNIIYRYMTNDRNKFNTSHDITGYIDKDVERLFVVPYPSKDNSMRKISLANAELLEEDEVTR